MRIAILKDIVYFKNLIKLDEPRSFDYYNTRNLYGKEGMYFQNDNKLNVTLENREVALTED